MLKMGISSKISQCDFWTYVLLVLCFVFISAEIYKGLGLEECIFFKIVKLPKKIYHLKLYHKSHYTM